MFSGRLLGGGDLDRDETDLERLRRGEYGEAERDLEYDRGRYVFDSRPLPIGLSYGGLSRRGGDRYLPPLPPGIPGGPRKPPGGPRASNLSKFELLLAGGGDTENLRRGRTMETLMTAPSS